MSALKRSEQGFTIVELMVATIVFSVVLIVVATGIIQFTRSFYRGSIVSKTQDNARTLIDTISESLQFGISDIYVAPKDDTTAMNYFCAGGYKFIYTKGVQYNISKPTQTNAGVYMVQSPGACDAPTAPLPDQGEQLLNADMRVAQLDVNEIFGSNYSVSVTLVYGSNDLLCDRTDPDTCGSGGTVLSNADIAVAGSNIQCKTQVGQEYCAVSTLSTVVKKRIQ